MSTLSPPDAPPAPRTKHSEKMKAMASGPHLDLSRVSYGLYGVKYIDPVSLAPFSGPASPQ